MKCFVLVKQKQIFAGNEFSTLEGIEMVWDLQTLTDRESFVAAQTVLR